jgi:hypothetical protein
MAQTPAEEERKECARKHGGRSGSAGIQHNPAGVAFQFETGTVGGAGGDVGKATRVRHQLTEAGAVNESVTGYYGLKLV